jgi:hypothetical protein
MKQKLIAVIFGLFVMANAVIPATTSASYSQWCIEMDGFVDKVGQAVCLSPNIFYYLLDEGYSPRDIATAAFLAMDNAPKKRFAVPKASNNKNVNGSLYGVTQILEMKSKTNSWQDVSKNLNVSAENFKHDMEKVDKVIRQEPRFN